MPMGICKLCLLYKELRDSHLMPRSLYKRARGSGKKGNQDPYLMKKEGGRQSSYQITDYVFCADCEDRFNKNGEAYALRFVTKQNGEFPLLDMLGSVSPTMSGPDWKGWSIADTSDIDREKIAYFAISVFWRASIHTWKQKDNEAVKIELGTKYNEEIRRYLLGETCVPPNSSLIVTVCSDTLNKISFFTPQENQKVKDRSFVFIARGLMFRLRVSNQLVGYERRLSVVNNKTGLITVRDCSKRPIWQLG